MKMHYCTCRINLGGQGFTIHEILATEPMSWPEIQVMMALHHEENIYDIKPIAIAETDPVTEKRRLAAKYQRTPMVVEQVFPGRQPQMEMLMPGEPADQPLADTEGKPQPADDDDDENEVLGREPPIGPAVLKPSPLRRPFPEA
jgi:hypothetical protein